MHMIMVMVELHDIPYRCNKIVLQCIFDHTDWSSLALIDNKETILIVQSCATL